MEIKIFIQLLKYLLLVFVCPIQFVKLIHKVYKNPVEDLDNFIFFRDNQTRLNWHNSVVNRIVFY